MGSEASKYELTPEEVQQIESTINDTLNNILQEQQTLLYFYTMKRAVILGQQDPELLPQLVRGKLSIPIKTYEGPVEKEGGSVKSWKKRYMVLTKDAEMVYYVDKAAATTGKKAKGSFSLTGYQAIPDPVTAQNQRNKKLADAIGWKDKSTIPPPIKYPNYTIELYNEKARIYHFHPLSNDEKTKWLKFIKNALNPIKSSNKEWVTTKTFQRSVNKYLVGHGLRQKVVIMDSPFQTYVAFLSEELEQKLFGTKYKSFQGDWEKQTGMYIAVRNAFFDKLRSSVHDILKKNQGPEMMALAKATKLVDSNKEELVALYQTIKDAVQQDHINVAKDSITNILLPQLEGIFSEIDPPLKNCFNEADKMLKMMTEQIIESFSKPSEIKKRKAALEKEREKRKKQQEKGKEKKPAAEAKEKSKKDDDSDSEDGEIGTDPSAKKVDDDEDDLDRITDAHAFMLPVLQQVTDSSVLDPLVQCCDEIGLRIESFRAKAAHLNATEISDWMKRTLTLFLTRGLYTLETELDFEMSNDPSKGEPEKLKNTITALQDIVFERFKFDAIRMTREISLSLLHRILDDSLYKDALPKLEAAKEQIVSLTPDEYKSVFDADLMLEDILSDFAETTYTNILERHLPKIPARQAFHALKDKRDVDEDYLLTYY
ncbi:hypothetical protein BLNAU_415 [Blattamonas nauphoetae]|uniref:PH domain-containing protein n=1 Tax=Blattamonas nauphoetae TaxID=2049346 RepID=A0ABQ9YL68_9EUKA|nr:hypothetical protein BLNAU_415 [Blattamonas nauphoetae]